MMMGCAICDAHRHYHAWQAFIEPYLASDAELEFRQRWQERRERRRAKVLRDRDIIEKLFLKVWLSLFVLTITILLIGGQTLFSIWLVVVIVLAITLREFPAIRRCAWRAF